MSLNLVVDLEQYATKHKSVQDGSATDGTEGNYMLNRQGNGHRRNSVIMRDLDGSLTKAPGSSVVKSNVYYTEKLQCEKKNPWNMDICPDRFIKVVLIPIFFKENTNLLYFSTLPLFQFFIHPKNWYKKEDRFFTPPGLRGWDKVYPKTTDLHYTMRPGDAAVLHWDNVPMPEEVSIRMTGTQR